MSTKFSTRLLSIFSTTARVEQPKTVVDVIKNFNFVNGAKNGKLLVKLSKESNGQMTLYFRSNNPLKRLLGLTTPVSVNSETDEVNSRVVLSGKTSLVNKLGAQVQPLFADLQNVTSAKWKALGNTFAASAS